MSKYLGIFPEIKLGDQETDLKNDILNNYQALSKSNACIIQR